MTQANAIGLNVQERESVDTPQVNGPPLGQLGAVFESERGPVNVAVKLSSLTKFKKVFDGRRNKNFNAYFSMRGLERNAGQYGWVGYGVRAMTSASNAAVPATITGSVAEQFALADGDTIVIDTDNGGDETATFSAAPAQADASGITYPKVYAGGETLVFEIDNNGTEYTVTFSGGSKSLNDVLAQINAVGEGFSAVDNGGQLRIESDKEGTGSQVDIKASSTGLAETGFSSGVNNGTGNVADIDAVTFAEVKTIIEAATTGLLVESVGGKVKFTGTTAGVTGEVDIKSGAAVTKLGHVVGTTNGTASGSAAATAAQLTFQRSSTNVWTFKAGYLGNEDPGVWANDRVYLQLIENLTDSSKRDLLVYYKAPGENTAQLVETWEGLDAANVVSIINSPTQGSEYVIVAIEGGDTGVPDVAASTAIGTGTPGKDATTSPSNADYETALAALNGLDIQLVANLDLSDATWQASLESYCATRGDVLGIFNTPQGASIATIKSGFGSLRVSKSYTMGLRAWGSVSDEQGGSLKMSLLGHVVGAGFIRKPRQAGDKPHTSPAGTGAFLLDVNEVDNAIYSQPDLLDLINNSHVNPVVFENKKGYFLKTSRTMSTTGKWVSAHVRLLMNHCKVGYRESLSDFEQEANTPENRRRLRDAIIDFMEVLDGQDAFEKEGGFENNIAVVCNESNNPARVRQQRRMICDVTFRPAEIAEEVQINVTNTSDGILVAEA